MRPMWALGRINMGMRPMLVLKPIPVFLSSHARSIIETRSLLRRQWKALGFEGRGVVAILSAVLAEPGGFHRCTRWLAGGMRLRPRQAVWQVGEELLRRFRGLVVEPLRSGFGRLRRSGALLGVVVRPRRSTTAVLRLLLYGSREATKSPRPREPGSRRRCRRRRVGAD